MSNPPLSSSAPLTPLPPPQRLHLSDLKASLSHGWATFVDLRQIAVTYALIFACIGLVLMLCVEVASVAPMVLPLAGGFMLVGPLLITGYFALANAHARRETLRLADIWRVVRASPSPMWVIGLVCGLLFLIWMTDAATLYGFMVGREPRILSGLLPTDAALNSFFLWSSVMGAILAFIIFAVTAFSVPLIFDRRASVVAAVAASVRGVFGNFRLMLLWASLLAVSIIGAILLLPLFPVVFPVLAFASHHLYRRVYPLPVA